MARIVTIDNVPYTLISKNTWVDNDVHVIYSCVVNGVEELLGVKTTSMMLRDLRKTLGDEAIHELGNIVDHEAGLAIYKLVTGEVPLEYRKSCDPQDLLDFYADKPEDYKHWTWTTT